MKRTLFAMIFAALLCLQLSGCFFDGGISSDDAESEPMIYTLDDIFTIASEALSRFENHTEYGAVIDDDVLKAAVKKVKHSYPEYFWLNGYSTTTNDVSTALDFTTLNDYSQEELRRMHAELTDAADRIIEQIPAGCSSFEAALYVHDYLAGNTHYATEKQNLGYNGLWGNAYGCLVEGSAVCQGYAEAYQLILQRLGIECGVCTGSIDRGSHAWNYVKIDGDYYWVDVTWDDPESDNEIGGDPLRHSYFMIDDEMLLRTRTIGSDQYFVPQCSSLKYNYYVMTNAYLNSYFPDDIGRILAENAEYGSAEMMFADKDSFDSAIKGLFEEQEIWQLSDYTDLGYTLAYSCDDKMYVLKITY